MEGTPVLGALLQEMTQHLSFLLCDLHVRNDFIIILKRRSLMKASSFLKCFINLLSFSPMRKFGGKKQCGRI